MTARASGLAALLRQAPRQEPAPGRRLAVAAAAAVVAVLLVAIGAVLGRGSAEQPTLGAAPQEAAAGVPEIRPPGPGRTREGAVAAATAYLLRITSRGYVTDPAERRRTVRDIAIPSARDDLLQRLGDRAAPPPGDPFAAAYAPPRSSAWRTVPVGHRVVAFTGGSAVVEIWNVQLAAGPGSAAVPAIATWAVATMPLVWVDGGWRLDFDRARSVPGPTPATAAGTLSSDLEVAAADTRFARYAA